MALGGLHHEHRWLLERRRALRRQSRADAVGGPSQSAYRGIEVFVPGNSVGAAEYGRTLAPACPA
jgi:hypothetical protein